MKHTQRYVSITILLFCIFVFFGYISKAQVRGEITPAISANTKIVAFGDSLVVGTGATVGNDFVSVLSRRIGVPIINAGASGDTTATALARVDRDVISQHPSIVIVFLGGNDILQRLSKDQLFANLKIIIQKIQDGGAKVIVVGIHSDIFGIDYESGYRNVAVETGAAYVANALLGILGNANLSSDAIHPNDAGYALLADRVFPVLQSTINSLPNQDLTVTCSASKAEAHSGQSVTWTAYATGGIGNYRYEWSGTDALQGSSSSVSKIYFSEGAKNATVKVTSGNSQIIQNCIGPLVVKDPVLVGQCQVSAFPNTSTGSEYRVRFDSSFVGGATSTLVTWSGSEDISSTNFSVEKIYPSPGLKTAQVQARAGGQTLTLSCSATLPSVRSVATSTEPLGGQCLSVVSGKNVTWSALGFGASGNYIYQWNGTDGMIGTTSSFTHTYVSEGIKTGNVSIISGNEKIDLSCQVKLSDEVTSSTGRGCFIATAAFGTELEPEVQTLRHFRDEELLNDPLGRVFVDTYYKLSHPIADYIRDKKILKAVVRTLLRPAIYTLDRAGY